MNKYTFLTIALAFVVTLLPELALAADLGGVGASLCTNIVGSLTGDVGRAIATLAVIILGIGAFFGKVNWGLAIMVSAGIIGIFASATIAEQLGADGTC